MPVTSASLRVRSLRALTLVMVGAPMAACGRSDVAPVAASAPRATAPAEGASGGAVSPGNPLGAAPAGSVPVTTVQATPAAVNAPDPRGGVKPAVIGQVTFAKAAIVGRTFLYGSDIQYAGRPDGDPSTITQSMTVGHVPATFRMMGGDLQLVADASSSFESQTNHPEHLLHAWPVVEESTDSITIVVDKGSPTLTTVTGGATAAKERSSWVRSVTFDAADQLLLLETSVEGADGVVWEFMESLFPRESLVRDDYVALSGDPAIEPAAKRFRLITGDNVWRTTPSGDRAKTSFVARFDLAHQRHIDWYVTANAPDEHLVDLKNGVEGWNRYFRAMGMEDVLVFRGRLPAGVKMGDPRFNVINWDHMDTVGAAYESQATDPTTGVASHSLIYLPTMWVAAGVTFWKTGHLAEDAERASERVTARMAGRTFLGRPLAPSCSRDANGAISLASRLDPQTFARTLVRGTLFHEVGHGLGFAHDFKGSLSYDPSKPETYTTSIMDYNQYDLDMAAFHGVDSAEGPLLEYDRQGLSAIYHDGKEIAPSDPVLPAGEDGEADDRQGGVNPLCIRYDAGSDPSAYTQKIITLIETKEGTLGPHESLATALGRAATTLPDPSTVTTMGAANAALTTYAAGLLGTASFYLTYGAGSLKSMTSATLFGLYVHKSGTTPAGFDGVGYRQRVFSNLEYVANLETLPTASRQALLAAIDGAQAWLARTPAVTGLPAVAKDDAMQGAMAPVRAVIDGIEGSAPSALLTKARTSVVGHLARVATAPFYFASSPSVVDYEALTLGVLEKALSTPLAVGPRSVEERLAYAKAMKTYADTDGGRGALARVQANVQRELSNTGDAAAREGLRTLLVALQ